MTGEMMHKICGDLSPECVIDFIEKTYPELTGKCIFNTEFGCLQSLDKDYRFHFDPLHAVLMLKKI